MPIWSSEAVCGAQPLDSRASFGAGLLGSLLAIICAIFPLPAAAQPAEPLLGYCAPPFVPPCVGRLQAKPEGLPVCEKEMDSYVASVFRYRACLARETERAVRESNAAIARLRCAQKRGPC